MRILLAALILFSSPSVAKEIYFSDLMKKPDLRKGWNKIIAGHKFRPYDRWIVDHRGLRGPIEYINVGEDRLIKDEGCEPHDCTDNSIVIIMNEKSNEIWMAHRIISFPPRKMNVHFFGNPDTAMKNRLVSYMSKP